MRLARIAIAGLVWMGCERAEDAQLAAPAVTAPPTIDDPMLAIAMPAPVEAPPPAPAASVAPPPSARAVTAVPVPPSGDDPIDPIVYKQWLAALSPAAQARVTAYCRAHPVEYEATCGGIGPLHISVPPSLVRVGGFEAHATWEATLTPAQRAYFERHCSREEEAYSRLCGATPLVVAFDGEPIQFTTGGTFAFAPGVPVAADLPTATTPWIALDVDHDGAITSGAELFGSNTVLPDGSLARNGFVALAALDANHDGRLDAADPAFASLVLWADRDHDGRSSPDELVPLASRVVSIALDGRLDIRCDARRNCEGERATIRWRATDGTLHDGAVVDVYLPQR